jgi:hypothetical protein
LPILSRGYCSDFIVDFQSDDRNASSPVSAFAFWGIDLRPQPFTPENEGFVDQYLGFEGFIPQPFVGSPPHALRFSRKRHGDAGMAPKALPDFVRAPPRPIPSGMVPRIPRPVRWAPESRPASEPDGPAGRKPPILFNGMSVLSNAPAYCPRCQRNAPGRGCKDSSRNRPRPMAWR